MSHLHLPWLEASILIPLAGAIWIDRLKNPDQARKMCLTFTALTLLCTVGMWLDFLMVDEHQTADCWGFLCNLFGREVLQVDELSAPLLSLVALLYFLTTIATLRTKIRRFSFAWTLVSEAIALATFACIEPWGVVCLLAAGTVPPLVELRARGRPTRVYVLHMLLFVVLMIVGQTFVESEGVDHLHTWWAIAPLLLAVLIRTGIVPFQCWMTELFEHATFGTALLFVTPIVGAYAAVRLLLPVAPDWVLRGIGLMSLITAVYAGGMTLIQRDARRMFCYLFLSHSALVLVGLETVEAIPLTGALCVWLSMGLAMGGFGLTLRALESRRGRLVLTEYQGLYDHTPNLAMCFVLTGLAGIGFPGTFGFVGTELLVDGIVEEYTYIGIAVVFAAALNGIAVVQTYFRLFSGRRYESTVSLLIRRRERYAVLTLAGLIFLGGIAPQPWVASRYHAAIALLNERREMFVQRDALEARETAEAVGVSEESTAPPLAR